MVFPNQKFQETKVIASPLNVFPERLLFVLQGGGRQGHST